MLQNKPFLTLAVDVTGTKLFDVRLNGVIIYRDTNAGVQEKKELPVNQWMLSGDNKLEMTIAYLEDDPNGENVDAHVTLQVRQHGVKPEVNTPIANLSFKGTERTKVSSPSGRFSSDTSFAPNSAGDVEVEDISVEYFPMYLLGIKEVQASFFGRTINLPLNFPKWGFADSDFVLEKDLDDMGQEEMSEAFDNLVDGMFPVYKRIYEGLKAGKIGDVLPLFAEKNREMDQAYYLEPGTSEKRLKAFLEKHLAAQDIELASYIRKENAYLDVFPNRRMVQMTRDGFNKPIILFEYADQTLGIQYDIILRKSGDNWVVTR